ncbi:hypothetical protein DUI87_04191 [Hirundo rustica rustica]|uniref:glucuronosyltransferase n=1 Tax=Hirundo rustica rustica TaxID=333673 RepID=A0A3M0KYD6_HIRRU|nr:hypothetical protein DUI87_04191 [Hirundo rustica rustica]
MLVALLLPFLCLLSSAAAGKLLVIPMEGSHWLSMKKVLVELSKRGHEIVVIAPDNKILIDSSGVYELKTYPVPLMKEVVEEHIHSLTTKSFTQEPFLVRFWKLLLEYRQSGIIFHASCKSLLYNQELMKYIGNSHFDALLTDPVSPCGQIIALHFSIPSVFFLRMVPCALEVRAAQGPDPPSYVPRMFSEYTDHMTFSERVKNFLIALSESFICNVAYSPFEELASEFLQKPMTMTELLSHGSVWLRRIDFVFEYPMPVMPNMVFIGGIHCAGKKKPLSQATTCKSNLFHGPYSNHCNMALRLCCAWISILLLLPSLSDGGKLLVVPMVGSHWLSMQEVVEKLSERGHEVVVLVPEVSWQMETTQAYKVVKHPVRQTLEELDNAFQEYVAVHLTERPFPLNALAMYKASVHVFSTFFGQCKDLFRSQETLRFLNQSGFDAILTDPFFMCGTILAHHLSLPFAFFMRGFGCNLHFSAPQCPSPLSYIPRLFSFNSDHMTFFQRVENALISLLELDYCNGIYREALKLSSEVLQRDVSLTDLVNSAAVWLLRFDFVFEYVRPVMPNMVFVGGINCAKEKPLPKIVYLHNVMNLRWNRDKPEVESGRFLSAATNLLFPDAA